MSGPNPPEGRRRPRRGRWRVALRYASRDARRHKGRTALVAVMVALPAGLGAATSVLVSSTWSGPASEVDSRLGSDATVQAEVSTSSPVEVFQDPNEHMFGSDAAASSIPGDLFVDGRKPTDPDDQSTYPPVDRTRYESALARAVPSDDQVVPVATLFGVRVAAADNPDLRTSVQAHQLDTTTAARTAYDLPTALGPGEIALARSVASDLHVGVGDRVTVALPTPGHGSYEVYDGNGSFRTLSHRSTKPAGTFTVRALLGRSEPDAAAFGSAGPLAVPSQLAPWTPEPGSEDGGNATVTWLVVGDEPVTWADVRRVNALGATAFSRQEALRPSPEAEEFVAAKFPDNESSTVSTDVVAVVAGAVALGLLQAILMIGPAFHVGARRAARDLALLAAAGADARTIRRTVLAGGLVIGVVASLTSAVIGAGAAGVALRLWTSAQVVLPWPWLVAFILVGTLIAVAAAWLPARRASRLDPVLVLAGRRADPPPRRWPAVAGGVLAVLGTVVALVGAVTGRQVLVLVAGIVLAEIGLVLAAGSIVGGLARLARPLGGTTRLALRDAARQRARTAPAVAAVLAACAAATAGLVFAGSQAQHDRLSYVPDAATGTFLVGTLGDPGHGLTPAAVATITSLVDDADLVTGSLRPVTAVTGDGSSSTAVWVLPPKATRGDTVAYAFSASGTVVDDGTSLELLQLLGVPEPSKAAAALRAKKVVVSPTDLGDDGTATLSIEDAEAEGGSRTVTVPAAAVGDGIGVPTNLPLIPTDVAQDLGLRTHTSALVAPARDGAWSTAVQNSLDHALVAALPAHENQGGGLRYAAASAYVEPGHASWSGSQGLAELLIVAGALIVALAAASIATALAGTESLPDLATLQAVGVPPKTRRRFAAAQSAVITVTGVVLGAGTGLVIGATLVLSQRERGDAVDPRWMIDVPWLWVAALVVAIPLLGAAAAWLVTRSRLPLARRLDG
ncbi:hypothetical protein GCM10023221_31620 [Luteimicrobium xylanilyticum]|uniref:ABC3 transporter permease C-terminal domain-containing protein n=1 Tax=Luteimicrobium xylanilyticum TaxID=1133546 RepID=A0A5P9QCP0_9MICO|nr:ABC transporter permease [Luteimicrobium xylanilyticum]QFU98880.1 hypothetical protein KDY119_02402 [Luteimicrobium xylanilyticum]